VSKVLYIAGYGRSGSTVLDVILGNHPEVVSAGELTYLIDEWRTPGRRCACGASYANCEFWKGLPETVSLSEETAQQVVRRIERRCATVPVLLDALPEEVKEAYHRFQRGVFSYLMETAEASIVVDSSKSAGDAAMRLHTLSQIAGLDVYVLHLVRDGRATMASCVRTGSNWALEGHADSPVFPGMRAAAGWTLANFWVLGLSRQYVQPDRYLRIHFEDLTTHPARTLDAIGAFVGIDMDGIIDQVTRGDAFEVGHNVGGNRVRKKDTIQLRTSSSNRRKEHDLHWYQHLAFTAVGGWLNHYLRP